MSYKPYSLSRVHTNRAVSPLPENSAGARRRGRRWFAPGDVKALASAYEGWDAPVQDIIAALDQTFRWGIYDRPPLPYGSKGCVTLLGDAAHQMAPRMRESTEWIFPYDAEAAAASP